MERYGLRPWIEVAARRLHHNVLVIALGNKLARIAWSVLHYGRNFEIRKMSPPTRVSLAPCSALSRPSPLGPEPGQP